MNWAVWVEGDHSFRYLERLDGVYTQLTADPSNSTRKKSTEAANIPRVFYLVHILGKCAFLYILLAVCPFTQEGKKHTDDSYEKNLMADSGNILATDSPLPVQKPSNPPSAYIRTMAVPRFRRPDLRTPSNCVPPSSGGRVMRKIFNRSNGAVHVRDTNQS